MADNEGGGGRHREAGAERDWLEYRKLVLNELDRLNNGIADVGNRLDRNYRDYQTELTKIRVDIAMLQVKAGAWGALAAVLTTLGAVFLRYVGGH